MAREDFEVYEFLKDGHKWYGFSVEYYGIYSAPTKKGIETLREKIKKEVARRLEWIDRENKKYYARLAEEERKRALFFKTYRELSKKNLLESTLTKAQKKARNNIIYSLIAQGLSNEQIKEFVDAPSQTIGRIRHCFENKKPRH